LEDESKRISVKVDSQPGFPAPRRHHYAFIDPNKDNIGRNKKIGRD
jgi:hypothetical protein